MNEELKPCPFCRRELIHEERILYTYHPYIPYGEYCPMQGYGFCSEREDIISAWNTRPESEEVARLRAQSAENVRCKATEASLRTEIELLALHIAELEARVPEWQPNQETT